MKIKIKNAYANNLKNIFVEMPIGQVIGVSGVSGSGKSTLIRDIVAAYGVRTYSLSLPMFTRALITNQRVIPVDSIDNLPATVMIDVINSINTPNSTLSTVTGIHTLLRELYSSYGCYTCNICGGLVNNDLFDIISTIKIRPFIEIKCDGRYNDRLKIIKENFSILETEYYDLNNNHQSKKQKNGYARLFIMVNDDHKSLRRAVQTSQRIINTSLRAIIDETNEVLDFKVNTICKKCHKVLPKQSMSLFSFNVHQSNGGGACSCCSGTGRVLSCNVNKLINPALPMQSGGIPIITNKGIQYTTVTEKFLNALAKEFGFNWGMLFNDLPSGVQKVLLEGTTEEIKYTDRRGANGGKKSEKFKGFINYLLESYRAGKGVNTLTAYIEDEICPECGGNRLDKVTNCVIYRNYSLNQLLSLSLKELRCIVTNWLSEPSLKSREKSILKLLLSKVNLYRDIGCDYLELNRQSSTLSGGELQRLRLCTFFSGNISNACILLDEPTTGLHEKDIDSIIDFVHSLKKMGHTIIIIEHNRQILRACDYFVNLGPGGGSYGGEVIFNGSALEAKTLISANHSSDRNNDAAVLSIDLLFNDKASEDCLLKNLTILGKSIKLEDFSALYIQHQSVEFPTNALVLICGVSGSGKSTFVNRCLIPSITARAKEFGIKKIENLGQKNAARTSTSNVGSLLEINDRIAQLFVHSMPDDIGFSKSSFMINSAEGKCSNCDGKGIVAVEDGIYETCPSCEGDIFNDEILSVKYKGKNILEFLNTSIDELVNLVEDKKLKSLFECCKRIGVGYLSLIRTSKTLSKGELQRIKLANILYSSQSGNFYVLDEPSKGLHPADVQRLLKIIHEITDKGNTVVAVEHNIDFIKCSDYVIEFGPSSGKNGGQVVYSGTIENMRGADTATANAIFNSGIQTIPKNQEQCFETRQMLIIPGITETIYTHAVNYINAKETVLENMFSHSNSEYLCAIMPASNFLFSNSEERDDIFSEYVIPAVRPIGFGLSGFGRKARIVDVANLYPMVSRMLSNYVDEDLTGKDILSEIYSPGSSAGKCTVCKGSGFVEQFDFSLLFYNDQLKPSVEKLLKNRTNYTLAKRHLKTDYKLDIFKPLSLLSSEERRVLLFGDRTKKFHEKNKDYFWEGLNRIVIKELKYLDDPELAEAIRNTKVRGRCPICRGQLLNDKYNKAILNAPIRYNDLLTKSIGEVYDLLKSQMSDKEIVRSLEILINFGLSDYTLFTPMYELSEQEQLCIQLISYLIYPIQDSLITISNKFEISDRMLVSINDATIHSTVIINSAT